MLDVVGDELVVIANTGDDVEIYGALRLARPGPRHVLARRPHRRARLGPARRHVPRDGRAARARRRRLVQPRRPRPRDRAARAPSGCAEGARLTEALARARRGAGRRRARAADVPTTRSARACSPGARWRDFQEFMIRERGEGPVDGVEFAASRRRRPPPRGARGDRRRRAIVVGPSNPVDLDRPDPRRARDARGAARRDGAGRRRLARRRRRGRQGADRAVHGMGRAAAERRRASRPPTAACSTAWSPTSAATGPAAAARDRHAHGRRRRRAGRVARDAALRTFARRYAGAMHDGRRPAGEALRRRQAAPRRDDRAAGPGARWPRRCSPTSWPRCGARSAST